MVVEAAGVADISRCTELALELRRANDELESFTSIVSHDLKSPLRGIADLTDWIAEDLPDASPQVRRNFERIRLRIQKMQRLLDDLLAYSRANAAGVASTEINVRDLIDRVLEVQTIPEEFTISVDLRVPRVYGPAVAVETVLRNLVSNAIHHHDMRSGSVSVRVELEGEYCLFSVADNGPGISATLRRHIDDMFLGAVPHGVSHGGLGLAIAKRLADRHGGKLRLCASEGERGAEFCVLWPRVPMPEEAA